MEPLKHHLCTFQYFLLYYKRKSRKLYGPLDEYNVLSIWKSDFQNFCQLDELTIDFATKGVPVIPKTNSSSVVAGVGAPIDMLTAQEFRRGVKRDKTHYETLKDNKHFNSWNRGFVATTHMHHTHLVLDEGYCPLNDVDVAVFKEMQTFMYAVLQTHLQTDKGKALVSQFEATLDAQSIYQELVKRALSSTAAQLSGDTLLQYITTTRYPGTWRGTSHGFVLHWKEQVMKYKKLELEAFPSKQKLRLLQNAVGDVTELSYIKQIGDHDVARGHPALTYDRYMELLLLACSTYDKKLSLPGKHKRAVYQTKIDKHDSTDYPFDDTYDGGYEAYRVNTDISEIMANVSDTNRYGITSNIGKTQSTFLPRNEWDKLSQEQKDG
jgi:hypothetical protein